MACALQAYRSHPYCLLFTSVLGRFSPNLLYRLEEWFIGKYSRGLADPLPADDSLLIYEEKCSFGNASFKIGVIFLLTVAFLSDRKTSCAEVLNAIRLGGLQQRVTEEWVRQLQRVGKRFLRKGKRIGDAEELDVQFFEFLVIGLPGREVLGSGGVEIGAIELNQDILLP